MDGITVNFRTNTLKPQKEGEHHGCQFKNQAFGSACSERRRSVYSKDSGTFPMTRTERSVLSIRSCWQTAPIHTRLCQLQECCQTRRNRFFLYLLFRFFQSSYRLTVCAFVCSAPAGYYGEQQYQEQREAVKHESAYLSNG